MLQLCMQGFHSVFTAKPIILCIHSFDVNLNAIFFALPMSHCLRMNRKGEN